MSANGSVNGKSGSFTLVHRGYVDDESQSLEVTFLEGSGTDELGSISGSMKIIQDAEGHRYELEYEI